MNIRAHLGTGRDAAVTYGELSERTGMVRRELEEAVRLARLDGEPIISGSEGLWLSDSSEEVLRAAERLRERAVTQLLTSRALRQTGRRMADVQPLSLWGDTLEARLRDIYAEIDAHHPNRDAA